MNWTLNEILSWGAVIFFGGSALIEIAPIKFNPWSRIAKAIGRAINGEVIAKVERLEKDVLSLRADTDERAAKECRVRILRFGDEVRHHQKHSKEHFDQILQDITEYEHYCETHKEFKNNMTVMTTALIKEVYALCLKDDSFL